MRDRKRKGELTASMCVVYVARKIWRGKACRAAKSIESISSGVICQPGGIRYLRQSLDSDSIVVEVIVELRNVV